MLAYLCGPIDSAAGGGQLWRRKLAPFLRDQLGHRVYDPSEEALKALTEEEAANLHVWQTTDLERFRRVVRKIIAHNMGLIENRADYVICYVEPGVSLDSAASAALTAAYRKAIPVYLVTPQPIESVDAWFLGCSDQVFSTVEDLKEYLSSRFSREKQTQLWSD